MFKYLIILLAAILPFNTALATEEPARIIPLEGRLGQLRPDSFALVKDAGFFEDLQRNPKKFLNTAINNIITFSIDEGSTLYLKSPFKATIVYRLYYSFKNTPTTEDSLSENQTLEITYDTAKSNAFSARNSFTFNDAVSVKVKIVSITTTASGWDPIPALKLTNEMRISRTYVFDCEANKVQQINFTAPQANADELTVSWLASEGADEYDLEWAYIDNSAYNANAYGAPGTETFKKNIFKNNASRVTLNSTTHVYNIPLLYEKDGKLFFRVRAIQLTPAGRRTETNWSDYNSYEFAAGHQANLNWQSSTGFAEEGKRKSVVQYFDGSLRNRQTVTKDNTTNTTVVAESLYDYQGRPVIQVLPSPTINSIIKHTPNFNNFLNSEAAYKDNYDKASTNNDYCNGAAPALDAAKGGAAEYYSPNNPEKDAGNNKLIPDAKGFPYTETKYLQDNTGRVAAQSGVGPDHRLNSGHETKYYYGGADQSELDALFGTEAGDASHYFKNMVRDANGQYSVSYVDMYGRTIATALAGDLPASAKLDYLPSKQDSYLTKTLTTPSNNIVKGLVIESSKGLLVSQTGNHEFSYSLLPESVNIKNCKQEDICYSCSYTLEITISDDCGNKQFGGQPYIYKDVVGNISTGCSNLPALFSRNFNKVLEEGSYTITKKLTIRDEAIKQHELSFMENNLCKTVQDFVQEQKNIFLERTNNCAAPCITCRAQLGNSQDEFISRFIADNGLDATADRHFAVDAYNKLLAQCDEWCEVAKPQNYLDQLRLLMRQDVTPPYGQYAKSNEFTEEGITRVYDQTGIFGKIADNSTVLKYQNGLIHYQNEDGSASKVTINRNGALVTLTPQQLTVEEFVANFQPSWGEALVDNLHPEILKYNLLAKSPALNNEPAVGRTNYDWDADFINTETFDEALQKGYLNPTHYTAATARHPRQFTPNPSNTDPFFSMHSTLRNQMHSYMNNVASGDGKVLDMWVAASVAAFCSEQNDMACLNAQIADPFVSSACTADLDMAWRAFRALYKARKDSMIIVMVNANASGAPTLDPEEYHSYFTDLRTAIKEGPGINDMNNQADVDAALQDFYTDGSTCDNYSLLWWNKLTPCDTTKLLQYKEALLTDLATVCKKGTDKEHVMGASSIAPGATNSFKNFDEVLAHYVQLYNTANPATPIGTLDCNASLLNFPASYSTPQVVAHKPIISKPDDCECEKLTALHTAYTSENKDANFAAFLQRTLQTTISNSTLDSLLGMCSGTIDCRFISQPLYLPPALQCGIENVCVTCEVVSQGYYAYKAQYPNLLPATEESAIAQQKANQLFAHFMNARFGFNKLAQEYLVFMDSCGLNISFDCESLDNVKQLFSDKMYNIQYDTDAIDTTTWKVDFGSSYNNTGTPHREIFVDGIAQYPYTVQGSNHVDFDYMYPPIKDSVCLGNNFTMEFRIKHPVPDSV
ncbi:MAG: hypothetical protein IT250_07525, partial [Chitinophagaceae bacterium]|nr:hypothetical protein [Chitinophagaceae bacterium]